MLEKLQIESGSAGVLVVILTSLIIIMVILPIFCLVFEHGILQIAFQEIKDALDLNAYRIMGEIELNELSHKNIVIKTSALHEMNKSISVIHPQIESILIQDIEYELNDIIFYVEVILIPTLYRTTYNMRRSYHSTHIVNLPLD